MNAAPYIPLAGFLCNTFFALFVFFQAPKARANRVYLLLGLAIAWWNLANHFLFVVKTEDEALFWARACFVGVIFTVAGFCHLSLVVAGYNVQRWIGWLYGYQCVLVAFDCTPYFIRKVQWLGDAGWYSMAGPAFHLLNVPYTASFISLVLIWRKRNSLPPSQKRRFTSLIAAQVMLFILGLNDLMPIIGQVNYPCTNIPVYPYGGLAAVIYGMMVSYSVLHHQLLDVHVTLSRYAAHFIRFAFLFFASVGLLLGVSLLTGAYDTESFVLTIVVFLVASVLTATFFPRIFGSTGLETWERRILGDRFEYQDQVRNFIANMTWHDELPNLLGELDGLLRSIFRFGSYQIILRDETTRAFTLYRAHPEQPQRLLPDLSMQSAVFQYFEWGKGEYLSLRPANIRSGSSKVEHDAREEMKEFASEMCFVLSSQSEPFGLLLVGAKSTGDPFTATDINLLVTLVGALGLTINQIRLKNQILQAQELELLGRMSRGMAHDLNNLLTPISTLLQLREETGVLDDELLPVAGRNVGTMRTYIREALFFSENLRPDFQESRVDQLIIQAIEVARNARTKTVEIIPRISDQVEADVDAVMIQRLIANLITNAIDASAEGSRIQVVLESQPKTGSSCDWMRIQIVDSGEGISPDNLGRVLKPYFTTKNRGDKNRGFGLGLAICRKIATLHGGNLSMESELRKGTTVQLEIPTRQLAPIANSTSSSQAA